MAQNSQESNKPSYVTMQIGDVKVSVWADLKDRQRANLMVKVGSSPMLGSRENRRRLERKAKKLAKGGAK